MLSSSSDYEDSMPRSVRKDEAKREIYEYRREVNLKKNLDPLVDFWKGNEGKYPLLAKLAKKYLAIPVPATSVTAERVFSKLGLLLSKRRLTLDPENVHQIIFMSDKL